MATLFSKPNTIVYLRRNGLLVAGRQIKPARLTFPAGVLANLEVVQYNKFSRGCQAFFDDNHLKGKRVLLVLDQDVVFEKSIERTATESDAQDKNAFLAAMPFDTGKRACVEIKNSNALQLYATNCEIYDAIVQALEAAGVSKILAITPAAAYNLPTTGQKLGAAIEQFIADRDVRAQANFAQTEPM